MEENAPADRLSELDATFFSRTQETECTPRAEESCQTGYRERCVQVPSQKCLTEYTEKCESVPFEKGRGDATFTSHVTFP